MASVTAPTPSTNGDAPVVNLDEIMGQRVAARTVVLAGNRYRFRPLNLMTAKLLEEGKAEEAFRSLIVEGDPDAFLFDTPAIDIDKVLNHIYGDVVVGEAVPPSPGSAKSKAASKRSKPTSRRAAPRSSSS